MVQVGDEQPVVEFVRITNNNTMTLTDRFNGQIFVFPPQLPVVIPLVAAHHIFGFHLQCTEKDVFMHMSRRFGWNIQKYTEDGSDQLYFRNIEIKPVAYQMVEVPPPRVPESEDGEQFEEEFAAEPEVEGERPRRGYRKKFNIPALGIGGQPEKE